MWIVVGVVGGIAFGAGLMYAIGAGKFGNLMTGHPEKHWWQYWLDR